METTNKSKSDSEPSVDFDKIIDQAPAGGHSFSIPEYKPLSTHAQTDYDRDLSDTRHEDTLICQVVLWLHKCESYLYGEICTQLENHQVEEFSSTVAFRPRKQLHVWEFCDGRLALSYKKHGPFVILPTNVSVITIKQRFDTDLYLLRF